jgi:hypothetical protein
MFSEFTGTKIYLEDAKAKTRGKEMVFWHGEKTKDLEMSASVPPGRPTGEEIRQAPRQQQLRGGPTFLR